MSETVRTSEAQYTVLQAWHWLNRVTGATASIHGALPSYDDDPDWILRSDGFTLRNPHTGVIGIGRRPFATKAEAELYAAQHVPPRIHFAD
jgi:hypothetical protein